MKCIRHVKASDVFVDEKDQEFCYYSFRTSCRRDFRYRHSFAWCLWQEAVLKVGCTWDDIKAHHLEILVYPHGGIAFQRV